MKNTQNGQKSKIKEIIDGIPMRSCMIMSLAGLYVAYLGYKLCKNVVDGVEGGGPGFLAAGIAFLIVGVLFLAVGARGAVLGSRRQQEEAAAASEGTDGETVLETAKEDAAEAPSLEESSRDASEEAGKDASGKR